jgi:hypothetical protein
MLRRLVLLTLPFMLVTGFGFNPAKMVTKLTSNPLISTLMSSLVLNANQAVGGAGALLGMAQQSLPKADFSKIAAAVPGAGDLIKTAKSLGGISKFGDLASMAGAFTKMGLSSDQVAQLTPAMTDFIGKAAGPDVGALFSKAIK